MSTLSNVVQNATEVSEPPAFMRTAALLQRQSAKEFAHALNSARTAAKYKPELAIDWCRYGASVAWRVNPGFFYCHETEHLLAEIAAKHLDPLPSRSPRTRLPERFLHIMTAASRRGERTRAVSRWIDTCGQQSPSELHSILVSRQDDELPEWLSRSAWRTGGEFIQLPFEISWLRKAEEVRARAMEYDAVILHVHPNDPLPNLAFYEKPVRALFFNQADHVFSLGMSVVSVIADMRYSGNDISIRNRAPGPMKCLVPIPLIDNDPVPCDKDQARKRLGLPLGVPIALTLGEWYKYQPALGYNFPKTLSSICRRDPRVVVVAIGISRSDIERFPELCGLDEGRFRAVGFIQDPQILDLYYTAADIYLDSFPCGSGTSILDAARYSLPVQRLHNSYVPVLRSDDPALDSVLAGASDESEYVIGVLEWLRWPERKRAELGFRLRAAVLQEHCGASWKEKWLDPAVTALHARRLAMTQEGNGDHSREADGLCALASLPRDDRPTSMFVAGTIFEDSTFDYRIRLSCVWRSVKPLLFDTARDRMGPKRLKAFGQLAETLLPEPLAIVLRKLLHPVSKGH